MKVITCISDEENLGYVYGLKASCKYFGLDLTTLVTKNNKWETHRNKDIELLSALKNLKLNEIVLFTDGYDTLFIGNEEEILKRYYDAVGKKDILISGEKSCYPDSSLAGQFQHIPSDFKYVNSGGIMGTVKFFLKALSEIEKIRRELLTNLDLFPFSNQYLWTLYFIKNQEKIAIDYKCKLFQTLTPKMSSVAFLREMDGDIEKRKKYTKREFEKVNEDFELNNNLSLLNKLTFERPVHLHFNSPISKFGMFHEPYLSWIEHFETQ